MKSNSEINLSVIIVNYNTADELRTCIQSVTKHTKEISYEIIVVDNNSNDHSKTMLEDDFPNVTSYFLPYNSGFSFANNYAMERSKSNYILLLNPDTLLTENSFLKMYEFLDNNPAVGAVGPILTDHQGNIRLTFHKFPNIKTHFIESLYIKPLIKRYSLTKEQNVLLSIEKPFEVDWISGGSFMVRRSIYDDIGGFDERFHLFAEDVDWCVRIKSIGWKVFYLPQIKIVHLGGISTHRNFFRLVLNRYRSKLIFVKKHSGKAELLIIRILVLFGLFLRIISSFFIKYSGTKEKHERIRAYFASLFLWLGVTNIYSSERTKK